MCLELDAGRVKSTTRTSANYNRPLVMITVTGLELGHGILEIETVKIGRLHKRPKT